MELELELFCRTSRSPTGDHFYVYMRRFLPTVLVIPLLGNLAIPYVREYDERGGGGLP